MTDIRQQNNIAAADTNSAAAPTPETLSSATPVVSSKESGILPLLSLILAVGAWVTLGYYTGYAAMSVAVAAIIAGAFACRRPRGAWRNTAITAIIASAVLIVVVLAFVIVLKIGLA